MTAISFSLRRYRYCFNRNSFPHWYIFKQKQSQSIYKCTGIGIRKVTKGTIQEFDTVKQWNITFFKQMLDIFSHYPVSEKYLNCHQVRVEPRLACRGSLPYITHQALECFWVVLVRAHRTVPKVVFKLKEYLLKFLHTLHLSIPDQMKTKYRYRIQFIKKNPPSRLASSPFTPTKSS